MKKIDFWGRNEHDERLLEEVLRGVKTATCTPKIWYDVLPDEEKAEVGDIIQLYTKLGEHKGAIKLTNMFDIPFGEIKGELGEKIAKGENSTLREFIEDHIFSWEEPLKKDGIVLGGDTIIVVEQFELVTPIQEEKEIHIVPFVQEDLKQIQAWLKNVESSLRFSVFKEKEIVAVIHEQQESYSIEAKDPCTHQQLLDIERKLSLLK